MTEFILLTGLINAGKSTTAKRMCDILNKDGYSAVVMSFAAPLKELAMNYFDYDEKEKNEKRDLLEQLSASLKELFGQHLFGYTLLDNYSKLDRSYDYVIIDDLRYKEEFDAISDFFPTIVIKLPDRVQTFAADANRVYSLLGYLKSIDYDYFELTSLTDYSIKEMLYGIE